MKFIPTKDYLLLELVAVQETTSGLILVKNQPTQGPQTIPTMVFAKVLAAGPLADAIAVFDCEGPGFHKNEIIAFPPGAQQVMNDGVKDFYLVKATAVVARVEDFSTTVSVLG